MTIVSKSTASSDVAATFTDNTTGLITPTGTRNFLNELIDSAVFVLTPSASTGSMFYYPAASTDPVVLVLGSRGSLLQAGQTAPSWLALGGTGSVLQPAAGTAASWVTAPVLGNPGTTPGTLGLAGSNATSTVTLAANASGASWTLRFPPSIGASGQALTTDGASNTAWTTIATNPSGASGTVLAGVAGTGSAFTASPTLGVPGTTPGSLTLAGSNATSAATLGANPSGSSFTVLLPASTGTAGFILATNGLNPVASSWVNAGQIPGVTTGVAASSGNMGEYSSVTTTVAGAIALTTGLTSNAASMSLTAGDWDVEGLLSLTTTASFAMTILQAAVGSSSATMPTLGLPGFTLIAASFGAGAGAQFVTTGATRVITSTTTTVFLLANATFSAGSGSTYGTVFARRRR
jgi:hypothetical protein